MLHQLQIPTGNQRGPDSMASVVRSVHAANHQRHPVELILAGHKEQVQFYIRCPVSMRAVLLIHLLDAYPGARLERVSDELLAPQRKNGNRGVRLRPKYDFLYLRRGFDSHDPITGVLSLLKSRGKNASQARITIKIRPTSRRRIKQAERSRDFYSSRCFSRWAREQIVQMATSSSAIARGCSRIAGKFLLRGSLPSVDSTLDKLADALYETSIVAEVQYSSDKRSASEKIDDLIGGLSLFDSAENQLVTTRFGTRFKPRGTGLCTAEEIALLWHPIREDVQVSKLRRIKSVELEPPTELPAFNRHARLTPIGRTAYRKDKRIVALPIESLRRHVYITGKTGVGKSSLMLSMMAGNMRDNFGIGLIDPHGDLYDEAIAQVPKRRTNDLILFDPSLKSNLVPFNPLDVSIGIDRGRIAEGVLSAFVKIFGLEASSAPRLLHILRNSLLTLVEQPDATLIGINRLLTDAPYRKSAMSRVANPAVREFWHAEFGRWHERDRAQFLASLQNKLGAFLSNRQMQLILGQPKSGFDLRRVMDDGQILLCNLSKGRLGESSANLLGALLLSSLQLAGESRADIPQSDRRDFVCYVDEVQNYATTALATSLSEARKYRAPLLVLANQYRDQLSPELQSAIIGNCGSVVTFQVGSADAPFWSEHYGNQVTPENLMAVPKYHAVANILIDGMPSGPMTIKTFPPAHTIATKAEKLKRQAVRQFARPLNELERNTDTLYR